MLNPAYLVDLPLGHNDLVARYFQLELIIYPYLSILDLYIHAEHPAFLFFRDQYIYQDHALREQLNHRLLSLKDPLRNLFCFGSTVGI